MSASITISQSQAGIRLDKLLATHYPEHSRTYFQALIDQGFVLLNGEIPKKRIPLSEGDEVEISFPPLPPQDLIPEPIFLDIIYEDEHLLALNKPAHLVVHPGAGHPTGTLVNGLLHHFHELPGDPVRPGIVHRLDKETSGLLLVAKTPLAHQRLVDLFADRKIEKTYLAICKGTPPDTTLKTQIGRHPTRRQEMTILEAGGKEAITQFRVLETKGAYSLVEAKPKTGRTHQIRVHLKHLGAPVVGDSLYGGTRTEERHFLHAYRLLFPHPITGETMTLTAPVPEEMKLAFNFNFLLD